MRNTAVSTTADIINTSTIPDILADASIPFRDAYIQPAIRSARSTLGSIPSGTASSMNPYITAVLYNAENRK